MCQLQRRSPRNRLRQPEVLYLSGDILNRRPSPSPLHERDPANKRTRFAPITTPGRSQYPRHHSCLDPPPRCRTPPRTTAVTTPTSLQPPAHDNRHLLAATPTSTTRWNTTSVTNACHHRQYTPLQLPPIHNHTTNPSTPTPQPIPTQHTTCHRRAPPRKCQRPQHRPTSSHP